LIQLELFPRTELKSLSDFQRLGAHALSLADRKRLVRSIEFYEAPKSNDIIRRQHANLVDRILGLRIKYTEEMLVAQARGFDPEGSHETWGPLLHQGVQTWVGLDLQTLQTPYSECLRILQLLKLRPYQHVVDLGAAYGRMGIVIGGLFIKNSFTGYEFVSSRVEEGNRIYKELGFEKCQLITQDLFHKDFELPEADVYFIYDYGQVEHIDHTLKQIEDIAQKRPVQVVVRGKFTNQIIAHRHQWLDLKYEGKLEEFFSIYTAYIV
jgi:precorrin-6B methylase 2